LSNICIVSEANLQKRVEVACDFEVHCCK